MARREPGEDPKAAALREARCLNPHPEQVSDAAFLAEEFFDARDVVQVKYEMVRAVTVDKVPVTAAAAAFGYSRPSYYQAAAALAGSGLEGLVPARPGPRRAHKLTAEILAWAEQALRAAMAKVKMWCRQVNTNQPLDALLERINPLLKGWTAFFRPGVSSTTFQYLSAYVWRRVARWIRRKHPGISRKELRRRYCGGGWWPRGRELALFNAGLVTTTRYRYRGSVIPSPWPLGAA